MLDKNFKVFNKKKGDNMGEEKQLVIRVTSRLIERIIFIVIILALLAIIIFQVMNKPAGDINTAVKTDAAASGAATTTTTIASAAVTTTAAGATTTTHAATTTTLSTTTTTAATAASASELKDKVTLRFTSDPTVESTGVVSRISFEIKNNADVKFVPKIEFLWYDSSSDPKIKEKVRGTWTDDYGLDPGAIKTAYQSMFTPKYVEMALREETFVMNIYNAGDGKLITSVSKTINTVYNDNASS